MEACYAEGSKICYNSIPQIPVGQLAHQNCIRRDRIVAPTSDDSGQSFGLAPPAAAIYQYKRHPRKRRPLPRSFGLGAPRFTAPTKWPALANSPPAAVNLNMSPFRAMPTWTTSASG